MAGATMRRVDTFNTSQSVAREMQALLADAIAAAGGWIGFDRFMALALYAPGLGYYANHLRKFGVLPESGSDFVTAPEMTPLFGQILAVQLAQAMRETHTNELWEFGAGSGALAQQILKALQAMGVHVRRYTIVDLSAGLRQRQQQCLAAWGDTVRWADHLPGHINGVVLGNEVLDAMPVRLLARLRGRWHERGVALHEGRLQWADMPTSLRPPMEIADTADCAHDYLTEIHPQAQAFVRTLADKLQQGAVFLLDYGFPEAEYYHVQRNMGTVMCHQSHRSDTNPLVDVGLKDITAHVNFTAIALAAQDAGMQVLGYTSQGRFLLNCGLAQHMDKAGLRERSMAMRLVNEHEMGELFKVIALGSAGAAWAPIGFEHADRTHRL